MFIVVNVFDFFNSFDLMNWNGFWKNQNEFESNSLWPQRKLQSDKQEQPDPLRHRADLNMLHNINSLLGAEVSLLEFCRVLLRFKKEASDEILSL